MIGGNLTKFKWISLYVITCRRMSFVGVCADDYLTFFVDGRSGRLRTRCMFLLYRDTTTDQPCSSSVSFAKGSVSRSASSSTAGSSRKARRCSAAESVSLFPELLRVSGNRETEAASELAGSA